MEGFVLYIVSCDAREKRVEVESYSSPIIVGSRGHSSIVPVPNHIF